MYPVPRVFRLQLACEKNCLDNFKAIADHAVCLMPASGCGLPDSLSDVGSTRSWDPVWLSTVTRQLRKKQERLAEPRAGWKMEPAGRGVCARNTWELGTVFLGWKKWTICSGKARLKIYHVRRHPQCYLDIFWLDSLLEGNLLEMNEFFSLAPPRVPLIQDKRSPVSHVHFVLHVCCLNLTSAMGRWNSASGITWQSHTWRFDPKWPRYFATVVAIHGRGGGNKSGG